MHRREALRAGAVLLGASLLPTASGRAANRPTEAKFSPQARLSIPKATEAVVSDDGSTAYLAVTDRYATVDISDPANPELLAERRDLLADRETGPMQNIGDVKQSDDTLAVAGPENPTEEQSLSGVLLVDVSNPANPVQRGFYETEYPIHNCFLDGDYLYLTGNGAPNSPGNPFVTVDVGSDDPTEVARWSLVQFDDRWTDVDNRLRALHDIWVRDGLAALAYWDAGTYLLDVSDPTAPEHLGTIEAFSVEEAKTKTESQAGIPPGNHHSVATDEANELLVVGCESWAIETNDEIVGGPSGIDIYDVSDPTDPQQMPSIEPPETIRPTIGETWTTAHNYELQNGTLYSSWYQGGAKRHDLFDPANPEELSWWADPRVASFFTAQVGVPGEFFVASTHGRSTEGREEGFTGLWTFPDTDGTGGNPELLTQTPTPLFTPSPTPSPTSSPTVSPTASETATLTDTPTPTATSSPGFGALSGLTGLGVGAWRLWRGRRDEE